VRHQAVEQRIEPDEGRKERALARNRAIVIKSPFAG
jgi:hypothetical protein